MHLQSFGADYIGGLKLKSKNWNPIGIAYIIQPLPAMTMLWPFGESASHPPWLTWGMKPSAMGVTSITSTNWILPDARFWRWPYIWGQNFENWWKLIENHWKSTKICTNCFLCSSVRAGTWLTVHRPPYILNCMICFEIMFRNTFYRKW